MRARSFLLLTILAVGLSLTASNLFAEDCTATVAHKAPPNVIFIMADDLGYGDLGCYGQTQLRTPHIDRMASEGMKFTDFYAGSTVCAPSVSYTHLRAHET